MAQIINTNLASMNAQRNLSGTQSQLGTAIQRLSSGLRVNTARDDATTISSTPSHVAVVLLNPLLVPPAAPISDHAVPFHFAARLTVTPPTPATSPPT